MSFVPKDVIVLPESTPEYPDRWIALNVFSRTSLGVSGAVLDLLGRISEPPSAADENRVFRCWDIEYFSNEEGLLADPSRFRRDPARWHELQLDRGSLDIELRKHFILIDDESVYRARFAPKKNLLDWERFGNFHQQHGQHMMVVKRTDPAQWWMNQKFKADRRSVREDNLYGAVQWSFLEKYLKTVVRPGACVIDLGCGTGIYANLMARFGARVTAVDPSDEYLAIAREHAEPGVTVLKADIGAPGGLEAVPSGSADIVFMSDALLFYFVPFHPGQKADMQTLLADVRRILKPDGMFVSLEPHAMFYMAPWLGAPDRPFTVLTEYLHRQFGVVPPFSWLMHALAGAGFVVRDLHEIGPAEYFAATDSRAYHFAREFPLWQLLELKVSAN